LDKVAFYTLGCKVNQYETEAILEIFQLNNYKVVDFNEIADVYVINTCTVTNISDRKSRQMIRRARHKNEFAIVVVMGCYPQVSTEEAEKIENIDIIIGTKGKDNIIKYIEEFKQKRKKINVREELIKNEVYDDFGINTYRENTRAYVKIQDGCDRFCSYCIIPYARGRIRSRECKSIIVEIKRLKSEGFKEIVLTGIHLASYGKDREDIDLKSLIEKINKEVQIERIRLSSLEPLIIDDKFVDFIKNTKNLCRHFHLSLQSGCDTVLKRMNRKYTTDEYFKRVKLLKEIPDISLTTDIIVGFPGESEEEFKKTFDFVKKVGFYQIHVFKFSERKGTKASLMSDKISSAVKDSRSHKTINIANKMEKDYKLKYIDRKMDILIEQEVKNQKNYLTGFTDNYLKVRVKGDINKYKGEICKVKLIKVHEEFIEGEFC
jgi:threonylcarbamoyladenosine tRNA methylthiotransferase MtaB